MGFFSGDEVAAEWELDRNTSGIGTATISLVIVRRGKTLRILLRRRESALFGLSSNYVDLPIEALPCIRDAALEACRLAESTPLAQPAWGPHGSP